MAAPGGSTDPVKIKKVTPQELMIQWSDGHESHYLGPVLRGLSRVRPVRTKTPDNG